MWDLLPIFLVTGATAGLLAGLFGVGGGLIMVPALAWVLPRLGYDAALIMQMAISTSLAVIAITSLSSTRAHHARGGVLWPVLLRFAPGLMTGALVGAFVADRLSGNTLKAIVGIGAILVALQMLLKRGTAVATENAPQPPTLELVGAGTVIGLLSSLIGIGGGSLTVPYMTLRGINVRQAVGTSAACGVPIAWAGTAGFIWAGLDHHALPAWSLGYVSVPAFVCIAIASAAVAPLGARLAHRLPPRLLKRLFALLLLGIGVKMLLG